jgi:acetylornithine deacetylase/succinyl-diaminopimelate desuccinylase-like protein
VLESHLERFRCDAVVISDSAMFAPGIPSILYALRGLAYFQIDVQGPAGDLHSGMYGGAVVNPATALARIIASFHDDEGRIAIPGFYDDVQAWTDEERLALRNLPHEDDAFRAGVGAPALGGEAGYTTLERLWARPTCEVNGLLSGYTGEGAKTVLPAKAMAKVSFRLVPNQDPERVEQLLRTHVARIAPEGVAVTVTALHGAHPWKADLSGPVFEAAARALEAAYGRPPVFTGEGGSIPIVRTFQERLGAPVLLMGFGLPGENAHAPDEWIAVENLEKGMRASAALYEGYAERTAPRG